MVVVFIVAGFASGSSLVHGATLGVVLDRRGVHRARLRVLLHGVRGGGIAGVAAVGRQLDDPAGAAPADHRLRAVLHRHLRQRGEHVLPRARLPAADRADRDARALRGGRRPALAGRGAAVLCAVGTVWMASVAASIYSRSVLRTGSRVKLREVLSR